MNTSFIQTIFFLIPLLIGEASLGAPPSNSATSLKKEASLKSKKDVKLTPEEIGLNLAHQADELHKGFKTSQPNRL